MQTYLYFLCFFPELPDNEEGHQTKQFVISKLSLTAAEECYKLWGHNTCNTYLAHHQVSKVLAGKRLWLIKLLLKIYIYICLVTSIWKKKCGSFSNECNCYSKLFLLKALYLHVTNLLWTNESRINKNDSFLSE